MRNGNGLGFGPMESDSVCTAVWLPLDMYSVLSQRRARGSREMFLRLQQQKSEDRAVGGRKLHNKVPFFSDMYDFDLIQRSLQHHINEWRLIPASLLNILTLVIMHFPLTFSKI